MKRLVLFLLALFLSLPGIAQAGACGSRAKKTTTILGIDLGVLAHSGVLVPHNEVSATVSTVYWFPFPTALRGRLLDSASFGVAVDQVSGHFQVLYGALGGDGAWHGYDETLRQAMLLGQTPSARLDAVQYKKRGPAATRDWPTGPIQIAVDTSFVGGFNDGFAAVAFYPLQHSVFVRLRPDTGTLKLVHCVR